jgi:5-methyltetrahydropteroyltriglutamate--homocysteine methyltransferase
VGVHRELKFALERYWSSQSSVQQFQAVARQLRENHSRLQVAADIDQIPSNDFSLNGHVLDTAALVGAVSARYHIQPAKWTPTRNSRWQGESGRFRRWK